MNRTTIVMFVFLVSAPALGQGGAPVVPAAGSVALEENAQIFGELSAAAMERVRAEADDGNPGAAFSLAKALLAQVDSGAQEEGVAYLDQAAEAGIVPAQVQLSGILRSGGAGMVPDPQQALELLEDAASTGDSAAMLALGGSVLDTQVGKAGRDRAISLLENAAETGDINATNLLGGLYAQGRAVPLDPQKAMLYF